MAQFSTTQWPQSAPAFKGNVAVNGYPAGPKDSYITLGGFMDPNDANNGSALTFPFGTMVSATPSTGDQWVIGLPTTGYVTRGLLLADESIMYNEPMKPNSYGVGLPATIMIRGYFRLSQWTNVGSGSLSVPYLGAVPIVNTASGFIEFQPSGTSSAPTGFYIPKDYRGNNILSLADIDPYLGSTSSGGALLYISAY